MIYDYLQAAIPAARTAWSPAARTAAESAALHGAAAPVRRLVCRRLQALPARRQARRPHPPAGPATIEGLVYVAPTKTAAYAQGDPGVANVTVTLTGVTLTDQQVSETATTDPSGDYSFTGLLPGVYALTDRPVPSTYTAGASTLGSEGGVAVFQRSNAVGIAAGRRRRQLRFRFGATSAEYRAYFATRSTAAARRSARSAARSAACTAARFTAHCHSDAVPQQILADRRRLVVAGITSESAAEESERPKAITPARKFRR